MSKKILLVIKDPEIKVAFVRAVADVHEEEPIELVCVEDFRVALFQLNEILPDLLIAEIASGEKNGFVLCQYVRQEPEFAGIRVLLLDDEVNSVRERVSYDVGADAYLAGPFHKDVLARVVGRLLGIEEKSGIAEPVIAGAPGVLHQAPPAQGYTVAHPQAFNSRPQFPAPGQSAGETVKAGIRPEAPPSRLRAHVHRPQYAVPVAILLALAGFILVMRLYAPGSLTGPSQTQPPELASGRVAGAGAIDEPTQTAADKTAGAEARLEPRGGNSSAAAGGDGIVRGVHAAPSRGAAEPSDANARGTAETPANSSARAGDNVATPSASAQQAPSDDRAWPQPVYARPGATSLRPSTAGSHLRRSGREMKQAGKHLAGGVKHFGLSGAKAATKAGKKVGNAFKKLF